MQTDTIDEDRAISLGMRYDELPDHMQFGAREYVEKGVPTGGFFACVLSNDLFGALGRADHINRQRIFDICGWVYNRAPSECWGSPEAVAAWIARGGLRGRAGGAGDAG